MRILAVLAVAVTACGGATTPLDAGAPDAASADLASLVDQSIEYDLAWPPPPADAGDPPAQACGGDAGACALPPSECADAAWLVYYTGGACTEGVCSWTKNFMVCPSGRCTNGGCDSGFT